MAIETLLQQAVGCWAAGDPARFLALHSSEALAALEAQVPVSDVANLLLALMSEPIAFDLIGNEVTLTDPNHAEAYVEIAYGDQAGPLQLTFVREGETWLFDGFFFLIPGLFLPPE